ncbi:MAG: hypothetical protein ALAOOOJD_04114 [bacterium]|nr:hypothetical protein [bacterium]
MTRVQGSTYCLRAEQAVPGCCLNTANSPQHLVLPDGSANFPFAHEQRVGMPRGFQVDHLVLPTLPAIARALIFFIVSGI